MLAARQGPTPERLTLTQFFALFNRSTMDSLGLSRVDSIEYLNLVTYIVRRNQKEVDP